MNKAKEKQKLERIRKAPEIIEKIKESEKFVISARSLKVQGIRNAEIGRKLAKLEQINALQVFNQKHPKRYKVDSLDLDRLSKLEEKYFQNSKILGE